MTGSACNGTMAIAVPPANRFSGFHLDLGSGSALVILYLFIQRLLRYQRENRLLRRYRHETAAGDREANQCDGRLGLDLGKMTFTQASKIQKELASLEFPYTFGHSLELGFIQVRSGLCWSHRSSVDIASDSGLSVSCQNSQQHASDQWERGNAKAAGGYERVFPPQ